MFGMLFKKKVNTDKVANYFVNHLVKLVDDSFADLASLIALDTEFVKQPEIDPEDKEKFLFIVIAGNIKLIPQFVNSGKDDEIIAKIYERLATIYEVEPTKIKKSIEDYYSFFSRINFPSKNTLYAMSKAVFFDYNLNDYQTDYFRNMKVPNPILLKHLDELVKNYLIDWEKFFADYKLAD